MRPQVIATCVLHNPTEDTLTTSVLFIGDIWRWGEVTLDGQDVRLTAEKKPVSTPLPVADFIWYNPWTGEAYPSLTSLPRDMLDGVPFTVELSPGSHQLTVDFVNAIGRDGSRYLNPVFHLTYLLQPARYWSYFKDL